MEAFKDSKDRAASVEKGFGFSDSATPWDVTAAVKFNKELDESSIIVQQQTNYGTLRTERPDIRRVFSTQTEPSEQITLSWEQIRVVLPEKRSFFTRKVTTPAKSILKGVSGIVQPGTLLAVMGSSGSGKTTLLNVLTSRNIDGLEILGDVKVNGLPVGRGITSMSAYVQQEDLFVGVLTVKEHLWFQAMLRMDSNLTDGERLLRVEEVLRELGLNKCKDTRIGMAGRVKAISGGERKRLAFASEVLTNPPLMFCDEPTSGLDSFMAENVVQTLRQMASRGKTVICTIHQPSSRVFELFDNLLLLAEGRVAYMGPTEGAKAFFAQQGFQCPAQFNPADFYIRTLAIAPSDQVACRERLEKICNGFETSSINTNLLGAVKNVSGKQNDVVISPTAIADFDAISPYKAGYMRQLKLAMWRSAITTLRNKMIHYTRIFQVVVTSLFAGLLFSGSTDDDQKRVININGALFFMINNITYANGFSIIHIFPSEYPLFKREHDNGMYRTSVYYLSKTLVDAPLFILIPTLQIAIFYFLIGFRLEVEAFFTMLAMLLLLTQVVISFGYTVSTLTGKVSTALSIAGPACLPFMLFGGYFLNDQSIPVYFIWMEYISWFKYANEILVINQWNGYGNLTCPNGGVNLASSQYNGGLLSTFLTEEATSNSTVSTCYQNGDEIITSLNYNPSNMTRDFLALAALFVGYRYLGFVFLHLRVESKRWKKLLC